MTMIKVTKEEKSIATRFIEEITFNGRATVTTPIEHKVAQVLIDAGLAKASKLKNYGRIAEIVEVKQVQA